MANQITPLSYANTFGDWFTTTNYVLAETNDIGANNYIKNSGTFKIESSGTGLQVSNNAIVQGILTVAGAGSSAVVQNQLTVQGQILATNTNQSIAAVQVAGAANIANVNIFGAGVSLNVANASVMTGAVAMGSTLTVSSNARVNGVNANSYITTPNSYADTSINGVLYANTQLNVGDANVVNRLDAANARINNIIANTSLVGGTITANTQLNTGYANVINVLDAGSARIDSIIANTSLVGGTITANTQLNAGSANVVNGIDAGSARIANIVANTSLLGGTITANTQLNAGSANVVNGVDASSARITTILGGTITANTQLNAGSANVINGIDAGSARIGNIVANTSLLGGTITANTALNGGNLNVASYGRIATTLNVGSVSANSYMNTTTIYADSINANSIFANVSIIAGKDLTVQGNFVVSGGTVYNSAEFDLYGATSIVSGQTAQFGVRRLPSTNAYIQYAEDTKMWKINDVAGGAPSTYYNIVTEKYVANTTNAGIVQLTDSVSSTSTTTAATPNALKTTYDAVTNNAASANSVINTRISANVATINGSITGNVATLNSSITANAASANSVINTNISANVATINGSITSNVATINASIKANADIKISTFTISVPTGLTGTVGGTVTNNTYSISLTSGYVIPTTASCTNWDTAYTDRNKWDGGSTGLTASTGRTSLGGTTVGQNFFTLTNPSAVTFPRMNADNTVSALSAASFLAAIGGQASGSYAPATTSGVTCMLRANASGGFTNMNASDVSTFIGLGSAAFQSSSAFQASGSYAPATTSGVTCMLRANGSGGFTNMSASDVSTFIGLGSAAFQASTAFAPSSGSSSYAPATSGAYMLKGNGSGGFTNMNAADVSSFIGTTVISCSFCSTYSYYGCYATYLGGLYNNAGNTEARSGSYLFFNNLADDRAFSIANRSASTDASLAFTYWASGSGYNRACLDISGNFTAWGNVTALSDCRSKTNVKTITNGLEKVTQMRGVTFEKEGQNGIGVIAQEIREILPEVVIEGKDDDKTLSVAYGNIVGVLIEAIKELKAEVDALKSK